jgi:hypothetical protein
MEKKFQVLTQKKLTTCKNFLGTALVSAWIAMPTNLTYFGKELFEISSKKLTKCYP